MVTVATVELAALAPVGAYLTVYLIGSGFGFFLVSCFSSLRLAVRPPLIAMVALLVLERKFTTIVRPFPLMLLSLAPVTLTSLALMPLVETPLGSVRVSEVNRVPPFPTRRTLNVACPVLTPLSDAAAVGAHRSVTLVAVALIADAPVSVVSAKAGASALAASVMVPVSMPRLLQLSA